MNKKRIQQISEEVRRSLSDIVQNKVKDPRIPEIISISHVEVTNDLSLLKCMSQCLDQKIKNLMP